MKEFKQVHIIAFNRRYKYDKIPNTPDFYSEGDALKYWDNNKIRILDSNFYNESIVVIRKEIHCVEVKEL